MAFPRFGGILTLGADVNKVNDQELQKSEGIISKLTPELSIETGDEELIALKRQWIQDWEAPQRVLGRKQRDAERYWKGRQSDSFFGSEDSNIFGDDDNDDENTFRHAKIDNIIFESLETFLPQATRRNPEPIVITDNSNEGQELADKVRKMLIYLSDIRQFRLKIKTMVRHWALYYLGVIKIGWDFVEDEITMVVVRPQKLILDPTATIDERGVYLGSYIGEFRQDKAKKLIDRFPEKKEFIRAFVQDKLGTKLQYIEWWADDEENGGQVLFWTLRDEVLGKVRNPHWNYEEEVTKTDEFGVETKESFTQDNHFASPQFPYTFLSVFNLGKKPYDETSLIEQNLGNQDKITKRYRQIDINVDGMNGGWAISGELSGITKEQAASAIQAFRDGNGVWIPQGSVQNAVQRMTGTGLPADVFNDLQDARNQLRNIFGVSGSSPEGTKQEQTVRGKIIVAAQDQSRIGGGVSEYIEQAADRIYNQMVQFMYVYYDVEHIASIIGSANAFETVSLRNSDLNRQLVVSVKEGSMIPKDPLTQANQAIDLFAAGAIDPIELHTRLDDPNPRETVKQLVQFQTDPQSLFPEVAQAQVPQQQGGQIAPIQPAEPQVPLIENVI